MKRVSKLAAYDIICCGSRNWQLAAENGSWQPKLEAGSRNWQLAQTGAQTWRTHSKPEPATKVLIHQERCLTESDWFSEIGALESFASSFESLLQ